MNAQTGIEKIFPLAALVIGRSLDDPAITDPIHQILFPFVVKLYTLEHHPRTEEEAWKDGLMLLTLEISDYLLEWNSPSELKIISITRDGRYRIYPPPFDEWFNRESKTSPFTWEFNEKLEPLVFPIKAKSYIVVGGLAGGGADYYFNEDGTMRQGATWIY